jgi:hypothetical protein
VQHEEREEVRGKRFEGRGSREEVRGKRFEGRGSREEQRAAAMAARETLPSSLEPRTSSPPSPSFA